MSRVSPVSGVVLGSAALLTSPLLWGSLVEGTIPIHVALERFLATLVVTWVVLSAFFALFVPEGAREGQIKLDGVVVDEGSGPPADPRG